MHGSVISLTQIAESARLASKGVDRKRATMYTCDANIFVRALDTSHAHYAACHALLERMQTTATPMIDPLIVLAEIAGAISRELRDPMRGRIYVGLLRALPNLQFVP